MAQGSQSKKEVNKASLSRAEFLYRASRYLNRRVRSTSTQKSSSSHDSEGIHGQGRLYERHRNRQKTVSGSQTRLITQMRSISRKGQVRLSQKIKSSVCKGCDAILDVPATATGEIVNASRGGRKEWADVQTVTCQSCGCVKRFPIGAKRQSRRSERPNACNQVANTV